jgi:hypothetical protein
MTLRSAPPQQATTIRAEISFILQFFTHPPTHTPDRKSSEISENNSP